MAVHRNVKHAFLLIATSVTQSRSTDTQLLGTRHHLLQIALG